MDRPDREKIDDFLLAFKGYKRNELVGWYEHPDGYTRNSRPSFTEEIDQLLALYPDKEEIRRQERKEIGKTLKVMYEDVPSLEECYSALEKYWRALLNEPKCFEY